MLDGQARARLASPDLSRFFALESFTKGDGLLDRIDTTSTLQRMFDWVSYSV